MGWGVYKQPDGLYAVWDTIVDDFIYYNCTREDVQKIWLEEFGRSSMFNFEHLTMRIADGERKHPLGRTFHKCMLSRDQQHGLHNEKDGLPANKQSRTYDAWLAKMRDLLVAARSS